MRIQASLHSSLRAFALLGALLLAGAAHADWGVSINLPIATQTQYSTYGSTTVYGAPGSRIISTRQMPQTVCRSAWVGTSTQQCSTEYVTVEDTYVAPAPVYVAPAPVYYAPPVYVTPVPSFGYPGYGHNRGYDRHHNNHGYRHHNRQPGPPPTTIYNGNSSGYGIGSYNGPSSGSISIHLNGR